MSLSLQSQSPKVLTGADRLELLLPKVAGQRVALVVNQTSVIGTTHLVDTLLLRGVNITTIFSPEHGLRGNEPDGQLLSDSIDLKTGIPIYSLYGKSKKPNSAQLLNVDVVIFDIQDVGARFYTYISTLYYVMEACSEENKKLIVLDRPNPNDYIDGPVLKKSQQSFVGMLPIPIVYGLTIGELAMMINGEGWLEGKTKCNLEVIPVKYWNHSQAWSLQIKPSPNLPNDKSILLYPSLCLFEGTVISVGRGTEFPFLVIGNPTLTNYSFQFKPVSIVGISKYPPFENQICYGLDLRNARVKTQIDLSYLIKMYNDFSDKKNFFTDYFNKLAGNTELKEQIIKGMNEDQIRATWKRDLHSYKLKRKKYLLYP